MKDLPIENGSISEKEGPTLEFKPGLKGISESVYDTYSSFANTFGGRIIIGVKDGSNEIEGVPNPDSRIQDLWNALNNPQVVNENIMLPGDVWKYDTEKGTLIIIDVPRADRFLRPIYHRKLETGTFKRNGEGDYRCRMSEIAVMMRDKSETSYDSVVLENTDYSEIDTDTLHSFRNFMSSHNPKHRWNSVSDEQFAEMIGATVTKAGRSNLTVAGLLMFGKEYVIYREFPGFKLDYREYFDDDTRWNYRIVTGDGLWEGNVFNYYIRVASRIVSELDVPLSIGDDMVRVDDTETHKAVREALLNSLIHADYRGNLTVSVERRRYSISISNSGLFRIPLAEAEKGGKSDPRNMSIAKMFSLIGMVERAGVGVNFIMNIWGQEFKRRVIIEEDVKNDIVTLELPVGKVKDFKPREKKIIELMSDDPKITKMEISESLGVSVPTISNDIKSMIAKGFIVREGGPRGRWVVISER